MSDNGLLSAFALVGREAAFMFIFYVVQFLMIMADLWSGVRKAKRCGKYISSSGLRRTVDKVCKYYNMTLLFTLVDVVIIVAVQHYDDVAGVSWPVFPLFTLFATLMVAVMEGRSIFEKMDRKTQAAAQEAAGVVAYLARHADEVDKIVAIAEGLAKRRKGKRDAGDAIGDCDFIAADGGCCDAIDG